MIREFSLLKLVDEFLLQKKSFRKRTCLKHPSIQLGEHYYSLSDQWHECKEISTRNPLIGERFYLTISLTHFTTIFLRMKARD